MPRRWSPEEEKEKRRELAELHEHQNRSIGEIAELLGITPTSVYDSLLDGTRQALLDLEYHPSRVSDHSVYLTRRRDIEQYIQEIGFGNAKHRQRAAAFGVMPTVAHT